MAEEAPTKRPKLQQEEKDQGRDPVAHLRALPTIRERCRVIYEVWGYVDSYDYNFCTRPIEI